jgi:hypothetical protein
MSETKITPRETSIPTKFFAYRSAALASGISSFVKIACETEFYDTGSNYDSVTNYRFTAPVAGFYKFNGYVRLPNTVLVLALYKNGSEYMRLFDHDTSTISGTATVKGGGFSTPMLQLAAGDYIELWAYTASLAGFSVSGPPYQMYFAGALESVV